MFQETYRGDSEGRLVLTGRSPLDQVKTEFVSSTLVLTPEQQSHIEPAVKRLEQLGQTVTDGPTYRLESFEAGGTLTLYLSRRSYFDSVLLKQHPEWGVRSQVLAVVVVTECRDGFVIERRSDKVAALPGYLHPAPSGSVEPPAHPLDTVYGEAKEELGLEAQEISDVLCLGLIFAERSGVYLLAARATTQLDLETLRGRACSGEWERSELICAPKEREALSTWIQEVGDRLSPAGRTALVLEGARRWGNDFLEEHLT